MIDPEIQRILDQKQDTLMLGHPVPNEGAVGDMRVNVTNKGKFYQMMKAGENEWRYSATFTRTPIDYLPLTGGRITGSLGLPNVKTGVDNTVLIRDTDGNVKTDEIDGKVWALKLVDYSGTPTAGHIPYFTDQDTITMDENQLFWDASNNRLGIGTASPITALHLSHANFPAFTVEDLNEGANEKIWQFLGNNGAFDLRTRTDASGAGQTAFSFTRSGTAIEYVLFPNGNVGINETAPDEKLEVNGAVHITGDTYWTGDGSGIPYGAMGQENIPTTVTIVEIGTAVIVDGMSGGETNLVTFQNAQELKVLKAGRYLITWAVSFNMASGSGQEVEGAIGKGGVAQSIGSAHRKIGSGNDTGSMCGNGLLDLAANDLLTIMVTNDSTTVDVVIAHASLTLIMAGGT